MTAARILGVTIAAGPLLGALLLLAVGWCWGHLSARVRVVVVGATATQDDAALLAHERARFDDLVAQLDVPDDLKRPE
ncbi:hypothetical protein [Streptomyces scabiei]|uniref:hypothetical protein n=1 Tax=Streptomyces scabiei TaxID=1930 RepID=UPI0004E70D99|nr:hypothetical protein [Streptomyces scabiei]KFG08123.1 hypothetical protein IQ61_15410 [Streptomyces scabiei]MDX3681393.1 hypothetical protein [Streptomyces scabiei]